MFRKKIISYLVLFMLVFSTAALQAQDLIRYINGEPALTELQNHYYEKSIDSKFAVESDFATIDFSQFENRKINVNLPGDLTFIFHKEERNYVPPGRESWIGRIPGTLYAAHFTFQKGGDMLVGQLQVDDVCYVISPLTDGLHAIIRYDMTIEEGCETKNDENPSKNKNETDSEIDLKNNRDLNDQNEEGSELRPTGECNVRVLVAYTDDVDANRADIYSDIVTMINTANTGYMNSEQSPGGIIRWTIELALAYEEVYTETGNMSTDLNRWHGTGDSYFTSVHTNRQNWRADMCALLTDNGSGLAKVGPGYSLQFSVTGRGNFFSHTFHHELGHNAGCLHGLNQATQTGSPPYAGYGEPGGCFRTVLAYQDECGTGAGTCPRQNIFSDNDINQWNCSGTNYTPGTINQRNQDRLNLSGPIIVAYETINNVQTVTGNYNWFNKEGVHFAANNDLAYNSATNNLDFFSGSSGSLRASNKVTLGEGFRAFSGSYFRAYNESCSALKTTVEESNIVVEDSKPIPGNFNWNIYPNPLNNFTLVEFNLPEEQDVKMVLYDMQGKLLQTIYNNVLMSEGPHTYELDASLYEPGIYFLYISGDKLSESKRLLIQR